MRGDIGSQRPGVMEEERESISCLSAQEMVERETIATLSHNLRSDHRLSMGRPGISFRMGCREGH